MPLTFRRVQMDGETSAHRADPRSAGKILLLERGSFAGTHFAMMAHPAPVDMALPPFIAVCQFEVKYTGKEAHASAFPELGINAARCFPAAAAGTDFVNRRSRASG